MYYLYTNIIDNSEVYVPISDSLIAEHYGGNQSWFIESDTSIYDEDYIIAKSGCGLIAATNLHLYWALQEQYSDFYINYFIPDIKNGIIRKDEFVKYTRKMKGIYYDNIYRNTAIIGSVLSAGLNNYCFDNTILYKSKWESFFDNSNEEILKMIIVMLRNSIPVIIGVGPWREDKLHFFEPIDINDGDYDMTADNRIQFRKRTDTNGISGHYVTITELIIDKDKIWARVQTWGRKDYYIDFNEWTNGMGSNLVNGIINIWKLNHISEYGVR